MTNWMHPGRFMAFPHGFTNDYTYVKKFTPLQGEGGKKTLWLKYIIKISNGKI